MKKKLLTLVAFLMCAMMAFAMTACGDSSSGDEEQAASGDVTTLRLALVNTEGTPIYESTKFFAERVGVFVCLSVVGGGRRVNQVDVTDIGKLQNTLYIVGM